MLLGVNFLFPSFSNNKFLRMSIESVINSVHKFIIFVNEESRSGLHARKEDVQKIIDIANDYEKVVLEFVETNPDDETTSFHEEIYINKAFDLFPEADYCWMVHPDEIYDVDTIEKVENIYYNKAVKNIARFWTKTYYNTPHWVVSPREKHPSRRLWKRGYDTGGENLVCEDIYFHHPSFVVTREELEFKLNNSSHSLKKQYNPFFADKFDTLKTDKTLVHLHPVNPEEIDHVEYINAKPYTENMMKVFFKHLIDNAPYRHFKGIFDDKNYLMTDIERRALSGVCAEMIPRESNILEIGTWLGCSAINMAMSNPTSKIYTIDHYADGLDHDMRYWSERTKNLDEYYAQALTNLNQVGLYPHRVSLLKGSAKGIVPHLPNNYFDLILVDGDHSFRGFKESFIECWPKLKNYGFLLAHDTLLEQIECVWDKHCKQDGIIQCPWGPANFRYWERYKNIIGTNNKSITSGLGLLRKRE